MSDRGNLNKVVIYGNENGVEAYVSEDGELRVTFTDPQPVRTVLSQNPATFSISTTAGGTTTSTIIAAQGASTAIYVAGFALYNARTTTGDSIQLYLDNTTKKYLWTLPVPQRLVMNWNQIGQGLQGDDNKALKLYLPNNAYVKGIVYWEKV
jgi:hypothetical protein